MYVKILDVEQVLLDNRNRSEAKLVISCNLVTVKLLSRIAEYIYETTEKSFMLDYLLKWV